ncbi:MAG: ABC transporter permease subunit [Defluviitaleaceae bacterium]|nr:ABC transporter permease subunit [Defluviitaleaceae bacterium]
MKISSSYRRPFVYTLLAVLFWLLVWEAAAAWIGSTVILVPPRLAFARLFTLAQTAGFWLSIGTSMRRIMLGFLLALGAGVIIAVGASVSKIFKHLMLPFINVLNAMPLASFALMVLFLFGSRNLSIVVPFIMVMPIVFHNVYKGITNTDPKLLEMARVFDVPFWKRVYYIYAKSIMPYLLSAASIGIGFAWKSGISAELIGNASGTIGRELHSARNFFLMVDLYAWTIAIVLLSYAIDRAFRFIYEKWKGHTPS